MLLAKPLLPLVLLVKVSGSARAAGYLIAMMVLSELRRRQRDPGVLALIARQQHDALFLSVVSIGEIEQGIARERSMDPAFAEALTIWLQRLLHLHPQRCGHP